MNIIKMKTNHIVNPLGFKMDKAKVSFVVTNTNATKQEAALIEVALDEKFENIIYYSGKISEIDSLGFELPINLEPCTRYYWKVTVWANNGDVVTSKVAWFETAKMNEGWQGEWITPNMDKEIHPVLSKKFNLEKEVKSARAYICGLGLYELEINKIKAGDEYLAPNFNAYDKWLQYQTYDVTESLNIGENNIDVILGNGLYKGNFGFEGGIDNIYGDKFALICDIVVNFADGSKTIISSDTSWNAKESKVKYSTIYNGEVYDATFVAEKMYEVKNIDIDMNKLTERLSLPVVVKEEIKPVEIIKTPAGETVLDMGQNMTGWVKFKINAPEGTKVLLQYGELLQDGNFYRENLREAKAEFTYVSDGNEAEVRPHFTFYGFRYVKLTEWYGDVNLDDFTGCVVYSNMETTGHIETSNPLVNRLFLNAMWGQKGNFLDVPTDCPQRDERMGWTGDAQVFSGTASFNMDTYAFFSKYGYDLAKEQEKTNGMVPMVVPDPKMSQGCSSAWGDAATVIPWTVYLQYGDKAILENQFESMKAWVDFIKKEDDENGGNRLWDSGFHFGDWLALDGENPNVPTGGTEESFISSAYYCYSARIVSKAAKVIGKEDEARKYEELSNEVKQAIIDEFFTKNGRLSLKNQTAYIVALYMDLVPEEHIERVAKDLNNQLLKDKGYLKTGFVGSPYICRVLSKFGYNEMAYKLLLNKNCPSWLYPVTMGATTIWERWDSVLPDGKINPAGMNSLNHYAYGSIAEWMYRVMAGINNTEENPGFRHVNLEPMPDYRFKYINAEYNSPVGKYVSSWRINEDGSLYFKFEVPFNSTASLKLPDVDLNNGVINGVSFKESSLEIKDGIIELVSGIYEIEYIPTVPYIKYYNTNMSINELLANEEVKSVLEKELKAAVMLPEYMLDMIGNETVRNLATKPFFNATNEEMDKTDEIIGQIKYVVNE